MTTQNETNASDGSRSIDGPVLNVRGTVKIRRDLGMNVRPEAEDLDGKTFDFHYGWTMDENDPYPGEIAYIPNEPWETGKPMWIASGDLVVL